MPRKISPQELIASIGTERFPLVVDVRRESVFRSSGQRIAGSVWRDHLKTAEWLPELPAGKQIVVYCAHGHNVSELAVARLTAAGADAAILEGGSEAYEQAGGVLVKAVGAGRRRCCRTRASG